MACVLLQNLKLVIFNEHRNCSLTGHNADPPGGMICMDLCVWTCSVQHRVHLHSNVNVCETFLTPCIPAAITMPTDVIVAAIILHTSDYQISPDCVAAITMEHVPTWSRSW